MISIQLEGDEEFLDLFPDTSISLTLENPILGDAEKISPGSYSMPFDTPGGNVSPKNARKLKNPDVIENAEDYSVQRATLLFSGVPFRKGTLKSYGSKQNSISNNFLFGMSQISSGFKTAKLRDVIFQFIQISSDAVTKIIYFKRTVAGNYNLTINGKNYDAVDLASLVSAINLDAIATSDTGRYVPYATQVNSGTTPSGLIAAPYIELKLARYALGVPTELSENPLDELSVKTEKPAEYSIESFDLDDYYDPFDSFISGNMDGSAYHADRIRFPVFFNANPYDNTTIKASEVTNAIDSSGLIRNDPNWGLNNSAPFQIRNYNSLQPFAYLKWVLDRIALEFDYTYEGDFYTDPNTETILLDNSTSLDVPQNYIGETPFVFWRRSFTMSELVPDITVAEFFSSIQGRYNLGIYFNEKTRTVRLQKREPIALSSLYNDITNISSPIQSTEDNRVTGYLIEVPEEENDDFSIKESIVVGVAEETLTIKMGRIQVTGSTVIEGNLIIGPRVKRKNAATFSLRLFHFKGIVDTGTFTYAYADLHGDSQYEALQSGLFEVGIYDTFWKYWLNFQRNRKLVELSIAFPYRSLVDIQWERKYRFNRTNFLIKSLTIVLRNSRVDVTKAELITMK